MPTLETVLPDFAEYLQQGTLAPTTYHTYICNVRAFRRWLAETFHDTDLERWDLKHIRMFFEYRQKVLKQRPRSLRCGVYALRHFGKWLIVEGLSFHNPAADFAGPKLDRPVRELATDEEVARLLAACDIYPRRAVLARAVVSVLLFSGLRRAELLDLRVDDVDFTKKSLRVKHGKGDKERVVYPHPDCMKALQEWLALRPEECQHDYLFAWDRSRRVGNVGLRKLLEDLCTLAGLANATNLKPHSLRHNYATRLLQNGADLKSISRCLGHSNIMTTEIYLHCDDARLQEVAKYAGFREKDPTPAPLPTVPALPALPEPEERAVNGRKPKPTGHPNKRKGYVPVHKRRDNLPFNRPLPTVPKPSQLPATTGEPPPADVRKAAWRKEVPQPVAPKPTLRRDEVKRRSV